jgi:hypothetical protein
MKKVITLAACAVILGGCSSFSEKNSFTEIKETEGKVDKVPTWFIEPTEDQGTYVYGAGTGLSDALQFSVDKAMHEAKLVVADKIASEATSSTKRFITDNAAGAQSKTIQKTEKVSQTGFKSVFIPQYEIIHRSVFKENEYYRTYVLIRIDTTKVKSNDVAINTFGSYEESQADRAFQSLEPPVLKPEIETPPNNGEFLPVQ